MKLLFLFFYNFCENFFHIKKIERFLRSNIFFKKPIIFDIGSHKGKMANLFNSIYANASIYCFEPNKQLHKYLKKSGKNISTFSYAVGSKNEYKKIYLSDLDLTSTLSQINKKSLYLKIKNFILGKSKSSLSKKVKVITLNNFCKSKKIKKIDFLKIDVEGFEYMVLLGSSNIIKNVSYIMIEIQKNNMYSNYSKKKIENFLKKNDFKLIKRFNFPFMFFQDCIYKRN
jgi:FkbM family methyltransferase